MSVAVLRTTNSDPAAASHPLALAMWRPQPGALMLLGRAPGPLPKAGAVRNAALPATPGIFRAEHWPLDGSGHGFLAAIRLPQAADRSDGAELVLRGSRGADHDFRLTLVGSLDASEFGKKVAAHAGAHAAHLTRFMLDVMRSDDGGDMSQRSDLLGTFLAHAARVDGCVEMIMHVPQRCVILQGWGAGLSEPVELLLPGSSVFRHPASTGDFARADIASPATGSVLALAPAVVDAMNGLEKIFLLAGDYLLCRHVVEPRVLDGEASIGQIRHLLPRLNCSLSLQTLLRASLQPRFAGHDTLNNAGRPVRAALDVAVAAEGAGVYVSGWVFDPAQHLTELHLCAEGYAARFDDSWVRIPRPDVSAAFAANPAFSSPQGHECGFAVSTSVAPPRDKPTYLRFTFADGDLSFVPVRFSPPDSPSVRAALLASVDLHISSGLSVVEQHLAPFMARLPPLGVAASRTLLRGPLERARAIVVPLRTPSLPRSFISGFLLDPLMTDEQVVFVCGPEWGRSQLDLLFSLIRFYALPASVIGVDRTPLPAEAVHEAAAVSQAENFLLASRGIVCTTPGWRDVMHHTAGSEPAVCPTILFEDYSVRFAGPTHITFLDRAPFASIQAPLAGACADLAGEGEPIRADAGTFACCLIRRAALPALAQAVRFATEAGQEAAFFLSLQEAGLHSTWVPSIRVHAPEEDVMQAVAAAPLVDGWMLRHTWGEAPSCAS